MSAECEAAAARCETVVRQRIAREASARADTQRRERAVIENREREASKRREADEILILREVPVRIPREVVTRPDPRTPTSFANCPSRF